MTKGFRCDYEKCKKFIPEDCPVVTVADSFIPLGHQIEYHFCNLKHLEKWLDGRLKND